jgi:NAD(P)-dependent dehydrogenase (short-subunit alcohol dehydrogenase family)
MRELTGKTVLVTGALSGLGANFGKVIAREGRVIQTVGGRITQPGARTTSSRRASWPMRQVAAPRVPHLDRQL